MATLAGNSIASSYTSLLKLDGNTDSTAAGNGNNAIQVKTGDDDATPLFLNTDRLGIGGHPDTLLHLSATDSAKIRIESTDTTATASQVVGGLEFEGNDSSANANGIRANITATYEDIAGKTKLTFGTADSNASVSDRLTIDGDGNTTFAGNILSSDKGIITNASGEFSAYATSGNMLKLGANGSDTHLQIDTNGHISATGIKSYLAFYDDDGSTLAGYVGSGQDMAFGDANDLCIRGVDSIKFTANNGNADAMTIDSSANVGIGTASPKHYSGTSGTVLSIHDSSYRGILELSGASNSDDGVIGAITFANTENDADKGALAQIYTIVETSDSNAGDDSGGHLSFLTRPEAGTLTERMRIDSNGKTRITASTAEVLSLRSSDTNGSHIIFEESTTARGYVGIAGGVVTSGGDNFVVRSEADLLLASGGNNTRITITSAGSVGIGSGSSSPATLLHVADDGSSNGIMSNQIVRITPADGNNGLNIGSDGTDAMIGVTNNDTDLHFLSRTGGTYSKAMTIDGATGSVGIGTASINGAFTVLGTPMTAVGHQTVADIFGNVQQDADKGAGIGIGGRYITDADSVTAFAEILGVKANNTSANYEGEMVFKTRVNGGNQVERMRLDANSRISLSNNDSSGEASSTFLGYQAGNAIASGATKNLAIGHQALYQADTIDDSIAIGYQAMGGTDAGTNNKNIAIGNYALDHSLANSIHNVAIGYNALTKSSSGASNVAIGGSGAGGEITTAGRIVAIGDGALGGAVQSQGNTGVGYATLYSTTGAKNTAFGYQAANTVTDGTENTVVGWDADVTGSGAVNQTVIGSETTGVADNSVTLGNASVTDVYMAQDKGATVHCAKVEVEGNISSGFIGQFENDGNDANRYGLNVVAGADDGSGTTYYLACKDGDGDSVGFIANTSGTFALTDVSDQRLKKNIVDTSIKGIEKINQLKVRDFDWKKSEEKTVGGFIAQEVKDVFPQAVNETNTTVDGEENIMGVSRDMLVPLLIKAVQELSAKVTELENK
jgi:hypothetical protein